MLETMPYNVALLAVELSKFPNTIQYNTIASI